MATRRWRILRRCLLAIGLLVVVVIVVGPPVAARVFWHRLAVMLQKGLGATLVTSGVSYRIPYGVVLYGPKVTVASPSGQTVALLDAAEIELKLGALPHKGQPLHVQLLRFQSPVIHLARRHEGKFLPMPEHGLAELGAEPEENSARPRRHKLAEMLRLDALRVSDAQIVLDAPDGDGDPLLQHLNADVHPAGGPGAFAASIWGVDTRTQSGSGTIDVDGRSAQIDHLRWQLPLQELKRFPLPSRYASAGQFGGVISIDGNGRVRGKTLVAASLTIDLTRGTAHLPAWGLDLDDAGLHITLDTGPVKATTKLTNQAPPRIHMVIGDLHARSAGLAVVLKGGTLDSDTNGRWRLNDLLGDISSTGPGISSAGTSRIAAFLQRTELRGKAEFTAAASGPMRVPRTEAEWKDLHWKMIAFPSATSFRLPSSSQPFTGVNGSVELRDGMVLLMNVIGNCGGDQYLLDSARIPLVDASRQIRLADLRRQVRFEQIAGTINFNQPGPTYGGGFGKVVAQLRPVGPFAFGDGSGFVLHRKPTDSTPKPPPEFLLHVSSDGGTFLLNSPHPPLTAIRGKATVAPQRIELTEFGANLLGGTIVAKGIFAPLRPLGYDGTVSISDLDLAKMAAQFKMREPKHGKISGHGFANVHLWSATATPIRDGAAGGLQRLMAEGEFEIYGGDFYPIPVMENVVEGIRHSEELTVGEAAGVFSIAEQQITLKNAAVSAPAIGLQGSGKIGFDKKLDLTAVAAPLGDWADKIKQGHIPIVSDVAGNVVGAVQQLFNAAQGTLLFNIHVTGTIDHPLVEKVPAPIITQPIALLFGEMLQPEGKRPKLIETIREKKK